MTDIAPFDVCGPLPTGVTVLEASAGTGKTFTIAALAARYVAEGIVALDQLLLVTFTRVATSELRDRVHERFVSAEQGLARALAGVPVPERDDVLRLLAAGPREEVEKRRQRLAAALADFDAATIATTHGFCQHVLSGLGVAGDVDLDATFVDDVPDLVEEVVDDLYVRKFYAGDPAPFSRAQALVIGRKAVYNPDAILEPRGAAPDSDAAMRVRLAGAVRKEVERRKGNAAILTYDDLLTRLRQTLADETRGAAAGERLRARYRVALVDEFQDTDPVQWQIMRSAFGSGGCTLVLIGDPKQAIYAFRGADVYAYLEAAAAAQTRATLSINWRSDQGLVDAYDAVFGGSTLGHEGIAYRTVRAADGNQECRLTGAPVTTPLRVRIVHRDSFASLTDKGYARLNDARGHVAADLAGDIVRLVSSGADLIERATDGSETRRTAVRPGHIAVLVSRHREAALVRQALDAVGVPAVINGAGSVFATPAATQWLRFLEALERPTVANPAHAAALTVFLGWTAEQVAGADDDAWEDVHARLHRWAGVLRRRGVAALLDTVTQAEGLPGRILAHADGERQLTDLRHIGQLLHAITLSDQLGVTALTGWLRQRIAEAAADADSEDRSRRLDSDAEAVQVLTIYRSKGLEFPVVYCPYLWEPTWIPDNDPPVFHDTADQDRRKIDVADRGFGLLRNREQYETEKRGEDLRLAYVALTRAQHQAVVWWAGTWDSRNSALSRLLFSRDRDGNIAPTGKEVPADDEVRATFAKLAGRAPDCISVERTDGGHGAVWSGERHPRPDLRAGRFDRRLDPLWRRTSYSGITAGTYEARVASEAEEPVLSDEDATAGPGVIGEGEPGELRSLPCLLAAMPAGAEVGTFIHGVLERLDFTAVDLDAEIATCIEAQQGRRQVNIGDPALVVAGLRAAIDTPLGPSVEEVRLRDIGPGDRVDELGFELPLVGGDASTSTLSVEGISLLLAEHLPADDVLAPYAERLRDPALRRDLRGYLAGSLDLVLRVRTAAGVPRFAVVDYKTNRLGAAAELSAWHYRPDALTEEMYHSHYPLQALLYTVALHRYLRWRLPGYRPEVNLAGILYLFVRGMGGAGSPRVDGQPGGVFAWQPPAALVEALSDLFDRGGSAP